MASVAHGTNDVLEFAMDTSKEIPPDLAVRLFRASLGRGLLSWSKKLEYYVSEDQVSRLGNSDLVPKMIKSGHLDCVFYLLKKMKENGAHISFLRFVQSLSLAVEKSEKKLTDALLDSPHYLDFLSKTPSSKMKSGQVAANIAAEKTTKTCWFILKNTLLTKKKPSKKLSTKKVLTRPFILQKI